MVNRRSFIKNAAAGGAAAWAGNVLVADAASVKGRVTADGKGRVWATCQDGALYAWDPQTGERRERMFTGVPYTASATIHENRLYVADFTGSVRCLV